MADGPKVGPKVGLIVPRFEEFPAFYQAADQMGFHSLWVTEMLFNRAWTGTRGLDPFGVLAAAATATSRIRLLTAVLWPMRHPILSFATEMASMDRLSGGRLSLCISNHTWPDEGRRNDPRFRRGGRLEESITVLKRLWTESEVSFKGSHFNLDHASVDVRPVQAGGIPILVAGTTSASLSLAATSADGWVHPSGGIPEEVGRGCLMVRHLAGEAGRDPDSLDLAKIIYLSVDDDQARARSRIGPVFGSFYSGSYNVERWCAFGPPAECANFIRGFLDIGINTILLCMTTPDVQQLERLHREVVPLLK